MLLILPGTQTGASILLQFPSLLHAEASCARDSLDTKLGSTQE